MCGGLLPGFLGHLQKLAKPGCTSERKIVHVSFCHGKIIVEPEPKINVKINVQHKHLFTIANILHSFVVLDIDFT